MSKDKIGTPVDGCFEYQIVIWVRRDGPVALGGWKRLCEFFESEMRNSTSSAVRRKAVS